MFFDYLIDRNMTDCVAHLFIISHGVIKATIGCGSPQYMPACLREKKRNGRK